MTVNTRIMKQNRKCKRLDVARKLKVKIDTNNKIIYANQYFNEVAGFKISDIILKDLAYIVDPSMPKILLDKLEELEQNHELFYYIYKGLTKDGDCYWSFAKITSRYNEEGENIGWLIEGKMLPDVAISKIVKLFEVLKEIENNAGTEAAKKYFEGFIEEKNLNFNEFILAVTGVTEKKALQYVDIDEDEAATKKKKKGWF